MLNPLREAGLAKMNEDSLPDRVITKSAKEVLLYTKGGLIASFLPAPVFASPMWAVLEAELGCRSTMPRQLPASNPQILSYDFLE